MSRGHNWKSSSTALLGHATGFVGKTGRGTAELFNVEDKVEIINSTLGRTNKAESFVWIA